MGATIDQIEREVQFVCSYLPGSIGDKCEELVDKYGEKLIDALVKEEMDPKKVCSQLLPSCATSKSAKQPCVWGPEMWCASPFHARVCGARPNVDSDLILHILSLSCCCLNELQEILSLKYLRETTTLQNF